MKIEWKEFFSGGKVGFGYEQPSRTTYYLAVINGARVEKMTSTKCSDRFSIGNIDNAKKKYKSETELLEALGKKEKEVAENVDSGSSAGIL